MKSRQQGLQQAASVIFALVAVVPLLIFAWTLHALGVIRSTQAQLSLGVALAVALLGFWMFRSMLGRMAEVVQALAAAVEQANRTRRPPTATLDPAAPEPAPTNGTTVPASVQPASPPAMPAAAPRPVAASVAGQARGVPGIGQIRELSEVVRTMDALWHREATGHLGQRVQISVANSSEPLAGTLSEASSDGLILEQDDGQVAIAYGRVTAIDRLS
ncbi:MAG TPA: hypothetical protein VGD07_11150 [Methylomirabilota bacterium]